MNKALLALFFAIAAWSAIAPADRFTWWLEVMPAFIGLGLVVTTYRNFPLTPLLYVLLLCHAAILFIGGHYTYAEVPWFNSLRNHFGLARNYFDRIGHFAQGFVPAMVARELLLRTSPLKSGKWMFALVTLGCLGISAAYEIIEWLVAINTGDKSDAFLGTQGDVWDTQEDMAMALIGAMLAPLLLKNMHQRALEKLKQG